MRVVVETTFVRHPARAEANHFKRRGKEKTSDDPGGFGTQIVREQTLCPRCVKALAEPAELGDDVERPR